jgi:hypothetical protein
MTRRSGLPAQIILSGVLMGLMLPVGSLCAAGSGSWGTVLRMLSSAGVLGGHPRDNSPEIQWVTMREEGDRIVHGAGTQTNNRKTSRLDSDTELQVLRSWQQMRDSVRQQRYKKEPSLPFPEDASSQPQL